MRLSYDEIMDIIDLNYIPTKRTGYILNLGIYEVNDLNNTLKHVLPDNVKVNITIDDVRLKSNLKLIKLYYLLKNLSLIQIYVLLNQDLIL